VNIANLVQGSPEWIAYRARHFNASDAPAMMGCSPYKTRAQLLREMHTGVAPDIDAGTHKRYENGHRAEALARPLAEEIVGEELYPVVASSGRLSASFDGLTLDERQGFEHKALNDALRSAFAAGADQDCRLLPIYHRVQMEQQLLISGAERILFMTTAWSADEALLEEHDCWYTPDLELRQQIVDGWLQFEADLRAYVLPDSSAEPPPIGKAPETLPALRIEVTGAVTASNLAEFRETALAAIRSVNRTLKTDQDFADAERAVKWCSEVESRLKAAKEHALSQTSSIDALFKALDDIGTEARSVRLDLDKLVARRKTEVKEEAVASARRALEQHVAALNAEIAPMRLPAVPADFAGAIKGLRSVASMEDRLHSLLASAKVACDAQARGIRTNLSVFKEQAADFEFLFVDLSQIVHKAPDDFAATVQARIAAHRVAEEAREAARKKAAEEAARLAAEAAARAATPPATATAVVTMPVAADQPPAQPVAAAPAPAARTTTIPRELLLRVLRRPVTRTDADVTLLSEYAQAAADLIEQQDRVIAQLRKDLREEQREAQRSVREAVAEDRWARAQGEEYGSY
jgi:putative phage-type endonuclease